LLHFIIPASLMDFTSYIYKSSKMFHGDFLRIAKGITI
jgi:hypothetical protein